MLYCEKCHLTCEEEKCEQCGNAKLRPVLDDDFVLFAELDSLQSDMLKGALAQQNIPCVCMPTKGSAFTMLVIFTVETFKFFVPFGRLDEVKTIYDNLFGDNSDFAQIEETPDEEFLEEEDFEEEE